MYDIFTKDRRGEVVSSEEPGYDLHIIIKRIEL